MTRASPVPLGNPDTRVKPEYDDMVIYCKFIRYKLCFRQAFWERGRLARICPQGKLRSVRLALLVLQLLNASVPLACGRAARAPRMPV